MERLQKIIAGSGLCSRRKAEELIRAGRVSVNGEIIDQPGYRCELSADIRVDGKPLPQEEKVVYMLNKPKYVISSASDDKGRTTVCDLVDSPYRIYPLGRLDYDSSGLILLSNDGELMQKLIHPRYEVTKTYEVTIDGDISAEEINRLRQGVKIDDYVSGRAEIEAVERYAGHKTRLLVSIHEGKNREIRKMFKTLGYNVTRLHRIKEATLELGDLKSGEYRRLKPYEIAKLKKYLDEPDLR